MRILIIEDDVSIGEGIASGLNSGGHAVDWFQNGQQGDSALKSVPYDTVVLDLGLPGEDGLTWLRRWRDEGNKVPVIVMTARDTDDSKVALLDAGADDYLVKPVSVRELMARLRSVSRRSAGRADAVWRHGALEYDSAAKRVSWRGAAVDLTSREIALLEVFLQNPSRVMSRSQLLEHIYSWDQAGDKGSESNALEVFVHNIRRKLAPEVVRTLRGIGYALGPPVE